MLKQFSRFWLIAWRYLIFFPDTYQSSSEIHGVPGNIPYFAIPNFFNSSPILSCHENDDEKFTIDQDL